MGMVVDGVLGILPNKFLGCVADLVICYASRCDCCLRFALEGMVTIFTTDLLLVAIVACVLPWQAW